MPLFSICIPAYNTEDRIQKCLDSIAIQDCDSYEIIIVDDGSEKPVVLGKGSSYTDATLSSRVRVIRQANSGTYAARQTAMRNAHGEYFLCVDADDALAHPQVLSRIADAIKASHPDVLFFNAAREDGLPIVDYSLLADVNCITRDIVGHELAIGKPGWNSIFSMVFRGDLFCPRTDRPKLVFAEDRLQKAEILNKSSKYMLLDEVFYSYSTVPTSITNAGFKPEFFDDLSYVEREMRSQYRHFFHGDEETAMSYLSGVVLSSFYLLRHTPAYDAMDRIALYSRFRKDDPFENLINMTRCCDWKAKDWLCLSAFKNKQMRLLDVLLTGRMIGGRAKLLLQAFRARKRGR